MHLYEVITMGSYATQKYATESVSFPKSASSAPGQRSYATFSDLPATSTTVGNTAFVVATNKLYMWTGAGWYLIATVTNAQPSSITGINDSYFLAIDGSATTITAVATDPEGFDLTWSYAVTAGSLTVVPAALAVGVANSGASAYTLSGGATGDNANVAIKVGQTVNFTVNASGHPFYIRDSNGGSNVSSPAATGQGAVSGVVSWTPNTTGTYYYQCGNHNAMVGTITVTAAGVTATVAQADNVFTITPSTLVANEGTFSLTFNVTDGVNATVSKVSAMTLVFYTYIKPQLNTEYTHLLANPSIYAQTDNDIEFTMPSKGGGWYQGRTFVASVKIPINTGTGKVYFELVCSNGGGYPVNTMWTFSKSNWSTTPAANGGANDDHGWVYTTGYYYQTPNAPTITNAYTDFATNAPGGGAGTGAGADRVGVAYDPNGNNLKGEWWFRKGQSAWAWGNPTNAGSGYRSTHAATVANAHTYVYFWISDGSGADWPNRRVKFFGKPLHLYTTPSGYTAM